MAHGTTSNRYYKVSVVAIKKAGSVSGQDYGNFSVTLRKIDDTDNKVVAVESYANCNLDPNSPNYIARLIGDREVSSDANGKILTTGDYPNISRHIRVEVHENVRNAVYSDQLVPFGHEPYISPFSLTNANGEGTATAFYPEAALVTSRSKDFSCASVAEATQSRVISPAPPSDFSKSINNVSSALITTSIIFSIFKQIASLAAVLAYINLAILFYF